MTQAPSGLDPFSGEWRLEFVDNVLRLRDPAMKDYTLAANSPVWAIGFEEIDVAAIGPGGDVTSTKESP